MLDEKKTREILGWYFSTIFYNKLYYNAQTTQHIPDMEIKDRYKYIISIYVTRVCETSFDTILKSIADDFNKWTNSKSFNSCGIVDEICDIFLMNEYSKKLNYNDKKKFVKTNLILCIKEFSSLIIKRWVDDIMINDDKPKQTMVADNLRSLFIDILHKKKDSINNKFILKELNPRPDTISTNAMNTIKKLIHEKSQVARLAKDLDQQNVSKSSLIKSLKVKVSDLETAMSELKRKNEHLESLNRRHQNLNSMNQYEESFDPFQNIRSNSNITFKSHNEEKNEHLDSALQYPKDSALQYPKDSNLENRFLQYGSHRSTSQGLNPPHAPPAIQDRTSGYPLDPKATLREAFRREQAESEESIDRVSGAHEKQNLLDSVKLNFMDDDVSMKPKPKRKSNSKSKSKKKPNSPSENENELRLQELDISNFMNKIENIDNELVSR